MSVEDVIVNILITPIIFALSLFFATFIALFDFIKFPIDMLMELWR